MSHSNSSNGSHEPGADGARTDRSPSTPCDSPTGVVVEGGQEANCQLESSEDSESRRGFLSQAATVSMAVGMVASYGTLAAYAGKFLFTMQDDRALLFVAAAHEIAPGDSRSFESPTGVRVTVTRKATASSAADSPAAGSTGHAPEPSADEFLALSSVCPHLGCRVHWESVNNRFFCPCHNGEFDPEGRATGGPPKAANQELPRYRVVIDKGLVFLEMPL
ncbi:MAG TPA: Rieske 2Fe-2S domain-containing protein, partial [Pirellulaceae bacterium]|nr:Rieske 2Fe-2S domain-containing protein [Pirellulaceae bacterium]